MKKKVLFDDKFRHRIGLKGFSTALTGQQVFGEMKWNGAHTGHVWTLSEWCSKHLFLDEMKEEIIEGGINFCNESKSVKIYPGKGKVSLAMDTRKEYGDTPRRDTEGWAHLLIEQAVSPADRIMLDKMDKLVAELAFRINRSDLYMTPEQFRPLSHSAQFTWYFTVENCKGKVFDVEGRPDYLWFGLPLYDYRYNKIEGPQVFLDHGTQKVIYGMNRDEYLPDCDIIEIGKEYRFKYDILPEIKRAFSIAKGQGWLKGATFADMAIGSTNIGWEIPGTFDCEVEINKISLTAEVTDK